MTFIVADIKCDCVPANDGLKSMYRKNKHIYNGCSPISILMKLKELTKEINHDLKLTTSF